MLPDRNRNSPE